MKTIDYDRLASSRPINTDAGLAYSGSGEHWEPKGRINEDVFDTPPKMARTLPRDATHLPDLRGVRTGRLTVVGWSTERKARWVCRCVCGGYVFRTTRSIRQQKHEVGDRCGRCEKTLTLQRRASDPRIAALAYDKGNPTP